MKIKSFRSKYLRIDDLQIHRLCGSLGVHVDLKNKYIAFHILWFYIHIGQTEHPTLLTDDQRKEFFDMQDRHRKLEDEYMKKFKVYPHIL